MVVVICDAVKRCAGGSGGSVTSGAAAAAAAASATPSVAAVVPAALPELDYTPHMRKLENLSAFLVGNCDGEEKKDAMLRKLVRVSAALVASHLETAGAIALAFEHGSAGRSAKDVAACLFACLPVGAATEPAVCTSSGVSTAAAACASTASAASAAEGAAASADPASAAGVPSAPVSSAVDDKAAPAICVAEQ
jgi:hypothetical protein